MNERLVLACNSLVNNDLHGIMQYSAKMYGRFRVVQRRRAVCTSREPTKVCDLGRRSSNGWPGVRPADRPSRSVRATWFGEQIAERLRWLLGGQFGLNREREMKHKLGPNPGEFVGQFMADPASAMTPVERLIHFQRNRAEFLRANGMAELADRDLMILGEWLDLLEAFYKNAALTYEEAAEISTWEYSTITNYVSQDRLPSKDRRVFLRDLPIAPLNGPIHAVVSMQALKESKRAEARAVKEHQKQALRQLHEGMTAEEREITMRANRAARQRRFS